MKRSYCLFIFYLCSFLLYSTEYFIDPIEGSDVTGNGTEYYPYKTWNKISDLIVGGDIITVFDGNLGDILFMQENTPSNVFEDWVTIQAADNAAPQMEYVKFGQNGTAFYGAKSTGTFDAYVNIIGFNITEGIEVYGGRYIKITDCLIETPSPWNGSDEAIDKIALKLGYGDNIIIDGCEITNTAIGMELQGADYQVLNTKIHHIAHDGIRVTGVTNLLLENLEIYNLDDGVDDLSMVGRDYIGPTASWSRHVDGIHFFTSRSGVETRNVVVRRCKFYDIEAQAIQFNNIHEGHYNLLFENNIFGPTQANLFNCSEGAPVNGLVFRNNSIIAFMDDEGNFIDRTYTSIYNREIPNNNYVVYISSESTGVEVYNNIFVGFPGIFNQDRKDHNIIIGNTDVTGKSLGRNSIYSAYSIYVNPEEFTAQIGSNSIAVDAGTNLTYSGSTLETEISNSINGVSRDNRPDIGAYEFSGHTPGLELSFIIPSEDNVYYFDDFEDGIFSSDESIEHSSLECLSWSQDSGYDSNEANKRFSIRTETLTEGLLTRNFLSFPWDSDDDYCLLSNEGYTWKDYSYRFNITNNYLYDGIAGPILLAKNYSDFYLFNMVDGGIYRYEDGEKVKLSSESDSALSVSKIYLTYRIDVNHVSEGILFEIYKDDTLVFSYTDTTEKAQEYSTGTIGFYKSISDASEYHRYDIEDIEVYVYNESTRSGIPDPSAIRFSEIE